MLTKAQVDEAIEQLKVQCDLKMADYESLSARSGLNELGYAADDVDQVINTIAERGFNYCLDSHVKCSSGVAGGGEEYPSPDVCYWGPDQLKSRLNSLRTV
jgi:hypothetical protein